jgi:diguanylate cyclase (GGDEF)-like protein/PAS domain S-box-containing protein
MIGRATNGNERRRGRRMALFREVKSRALKRDAARATPATGLLRDYQWPTFLIALAGLVLTLLAWGRTAAWEDRVARAEFATQANSHLDFLQEGFADFRAALQDYHGDLKVTAGRIGREQLDINAADLIRKSEGISSLAWVPRVSRAERSEFEAAVNRDNPGGYRIQELASPGQRVGAGDAAVLYPILYATTTAPGRVRVGLDLGSNPATRALLEQARDRGELTVSGILPFLIDSGGPEFITVQPVYRGIGTPISVDQRRRDLVGFTLGTFRLSQMINGTLARFTTPYGLHTYIYREGASAQEFPIYVRPSHLVHVSAPRRTLGAAEAKLHAARSLTLGNRSWLAVLIPAKNRLLGLWRFPALAVLAVGLLLCALATSYARLLGGQRRRDDLAALETRVLADRYSTVFNSVNDGIFLSDLATGRFVEINQAGRDMFGYTSGELVGATIDAVSSGIAPYTRAQSARKLLKLLAGIPQKFVWQARRKDGRLFWVDVSLSTMSFATGNLGLAVVRDVTEAKRTTEALSDSETRLRTVLDTNVDGIAMMDVETKQFSYGNRALCNLLGYRPDDLLTLGVADIHPPEALPAVSVYFERLRRREIQVAPDIPVKRKDGSILFVDISAAPMTLGERTYLLGCFHDVTARKQAEQQVIQMKDYDVLTGLANRRVFVKKLEEKIATGRSGTKSFAVLYLDLDHFKDVNDTRGHPVGNLLLQGVAERLLRSVRMVDTVARFGGDEFAILLNDIQDAVDAAGEPVVAPSGAITAAGVSEKILQALCEPFQIQGREIRTSATIGVAIFGPDYPDAETLLARADVALYRGKSEGRGTYRFFTDYMHTEIFDRVRLSGELREAITGNQLYLLYQPQVDIETGCIVGMEALVRWHHPTRKNLDPDEFIAGAEADGLIVPLGHWVLREACRQIKEWSDAGIIPPSVAINLSGIQLKTPRILEDDIEAALIEFGLPASRLELELTESVLMQASREHNDVLLRFRKRGHRIAIDDFGSGYSSLDYLRRYPVDRIKIAQSFIKDIGKASGTDAIVRAALALARELGIETIVEGVETVSQLELLKTWGARIVQGYFFAKPLPAAEVAPLLRVGRIPLTGTEPAAV